MTRRIAAVLVVAFVIALPATALASDTYGPVKPPAKGATDAGGERTVSPSVPSVGVAPASEQQTVQAAAPSSTARLPLTGGDLAGLGLIGFGLVTVGAFAVRRGRSVHEEG